jgi:endoglucanase
LQIFALTRTREAKRVRHAFNLIGVALTCAVIVTAGWKNPVSAADPESSDPTDLPRAFRRNMAIGRGINFGNALEAPREGEWGLTIQESYIQAVADSGFNSVRLPISWSTHMARTYPYTIDPAFLSRVDEVISWCLERNLSVIITVHHFNELYNYPDDPQYLNMFFYIWKQLTEHYLHTDHERLFFEILNEPEVNLTADKWNLLMPVIIDTIRVRDGDRTLIIDAPDYATHTSLPDLSIPASEDNVIVSTRYYLPWQFAQQGAWWSDWTDLDQYLGTTWRGTAEEKNTVLEDMAFIRNWSEANSRPVTIGEWGSIMFADNQSRLTWTNYVRQQIEANGFSWSYFDFGVVFKVYSIAENRWLPGFAGALTGDSETVSDGRVSDSLCISPAKPSSDEIVKVRSYIRMPNYCSRRDSARVTVDGSAIKVTAWHKEHVPQGDEEAACADTLELGNLAPGSYNLVFISDYKDIINTIHYSVYDTVSFEVSAATAVHNAPGCQSSVYPVPAGEYLRFSGIDSGCRYWIFDLKGRLRASGTVGDGRINISGLKPGEYIMRVTENANAVLSKRIIVAR